MGRNVVRISVIVPTHNGQDRLPAALASFADQSLPREAYEIIVVDNNSSDETKNVFDEFCRSHPNHNISYVFESKQGLHHARNRGILCARGDVVVFGDDDIIASSHWLKAIVDSFDGDGGIGIAGGPIYPIFEKEPPPWVFDYGTREIHPVFACLDYGKHGRILERGEDLYGCNFAIRRGLAVTIRGSNPDTFPVDMIHLSGSGEFGMSERVRKEGYKIYYHPEAFVRHLVPASRWEIGYLVQRYRRWTVEYTYELYNSGLSLKRLFLVLSKRSAEVLKKEIVCLLPDRCVNRRYSLKIHFSYLFFLWKHYARLVTDTDIRSHTAKTDYIADLES